MSLRLRFTPACAGQTDLSEHRVRQFDSTVHPRVCGADASENNAIYPRDDRFTPACAGQTPSTIEAPTVRG